MVEQNEAVPAATILMLRDSADGLEVFMVVRHHQIDFASGALVFPGGKVDKSDWHDDLRAYATGGDGLDALGFAVCAGAIREAFEECGLLLARPAGQGTLIGAERLRALEHHRDALNAGKTTLLEILQTENLIMAMDLLVPFAHWITPDMMTKRFDTYFFLARAPEEQIAVHDGGESVDSAWVNPNRALREAEDGQWTIIFPTRLNLMKLGKSGTVETALSRAGTDTIVTVQPWLEKRGEGMVLCIPADAGYDIIEEPVEGRLA